MQLRRPCATQSSMTRCSNIAFASQIPPPTRMISNPSSTRLAMRRSRGVSRYASGLGVCGSSMRPNVAQTSRRRNRRCCRMLDALEADGNPSSLSTLADRFRFAQSILQCVGKPMSSSRRRFLHFAAGAAALPAASRVARAQAYPSRPITMIVPYPPGGPTDTLGRIFAERMRATLGQPVIVENVGGAAGTIGVARVVRAAPDGYTINFSNFASHVFSAIVYKLQYDMLNDLEPAALLTISPLWLVASHDVPAQNLRELITW